MPFSHPLKQIARLLMLASFVVVVPPLAYALDGPQFSHLTLVAAADAAPALPTAIEVVEPSAAPIGIAPARAVDADGIADAPPTSTAPVVSLPASPDAPVNPADLGGLVTTFLQAVKAKNWPLVAGLAIFAIVFGLRAFGGRLHPWFDSRRGAVILTVATAAVGAVVTPLLAGLPFTVELLGQAVTAALAAMGVVSGYRALKKGGTSEKHAAKQGERLVAKALKAEKKGS